MNFVEFSDDQPHGNLKDHYDTGCKSRFHCMDHDHDDVHAKT
jgi:hypothetical protein